MHNTSTTQSPSHPKIEGLNALRFFAFFWVFCIHALPAATSTDGSFYQAISNLVSYGGIGVDIFFVLSSFLLTYLALREKQSTGRFSVKNFLVRRALRIFPLYFLILTFCFTVFPFLSRLTNNDISLPKNPLYLFLFLSNYDKSEYIFALKLLWTVSIEEQYYFTWALALFLSGKRIVTVALCFFFTFAIMFFILPFFGLNIPSNPLMYLANFSLGSLSAIFYFNNKHKLNAFVLLACVAVSFTAWWFAVDNTTIYFEKLLLSLLISFFMLLLITICNKETVKRNHIYKMLDGLGVYTYGLYAYSGFCITVVVLGAAYLHITLPLAVTFIIEFILALLISIASYRVYEKRFLKLSRRFSNY